MSRTSPAKCKPATFLLSSVLGFISLRSTHPFVTKDFARDILPVTKIGSFLSF